MKYQIQFNKTDNTWDVLSDDTNVRCYDENGWTIKGILDGSYISVRWRAKECACLYKEAHKGEDTKRGSGADWRFLAQANNAEYLNRLKDVKNSDRDMIELYFNRFVRNATLQGSGEPYYSNAGTLNVGRW